MAKNKTFTWIVIGLFGIFTVYWLGMTLFLPVGSKYYDWFSVSYGLMALIGGIFGLGMARKWEGCKSLVGRVMVMFSLGLLFQVFGQLAYIYRIYFLGVEVPYPSIGDIGYFGYMPCYLYGILLLGQVSGVGVSLKKWKYQAQAILLLAGTLVLSYSIFLRGYEFNWSAPLTILLDFGYPLFQAINVSIAVIVFSLSKRVLGGVMKSRVRLFVLAFVAQYVADFTFLYQASRGTWYVGGINDLMYFVSYTIMVLALVQMAAVAELLVGKKE
jgi:hypothetical protein